MSLISIDNKKIRRFRRATPIPFMPQSSESNRVGDRAHQGIAGAAQQRRQCQLIELRQSALTRYAEIRIANATNCQDAANLVS
jgi:hypothetical protein